MIPIADMHQVQGHRGKDVLMNTRARVKAVPALLAASIGLSSFGGLRQVLALEGHEVAKLQPTGFEEISLAIEESGVTGMPESLGAGRYLITATGPAGTPESGPTGVTFVQLPEGVSPQQALDDVMAAEGAPPPWYLQAHFGGGVSLNTGTEGWTVLDLTPGKWMVTTLFGTTLGVEFEVTGEFPADVAEPEANVVLELAEMSITVGSGGFVAGENLVEVANNGGALHFVDIGQVPDGTTNEQVEALFNSFMTGTPEPGALAEDDLMPLAYSPEQSGGTRQWIPLTLDAGTYFLSCWVLDEESMMPHAMMGMWALVTVE